MKTYLAKRFHPTVNIIAVVRDDIESRCVNEEVERFHALGRADRIRLS